MTRLDDGHFLVGLSNVVLFGYAEELDFRRQSTFAELFPLPETIYWEICPLSRLTLFRLKGEDRPIMGQQDRAELLLSLECVDAVLAGTVRRTVCDDPA